MSEGEAVAADAFLGENGAFQEGWMDNLPEDKALYNDYHAQWVALGKYYCKTKPDCGSCPLRKICQKAES